VIRHVTSSSFQTIKPLLHVELTWHRYSNILPHRRACAGSVPAASAQDAKEACEAEMAEHVPEATEHLTAEQRGFLYYVWQYKNISHLSEGLGENQYNRTGVRWRIRGGNSSLDEYRPIWANEEKQPGTIEVRIMQGTLDADHINNWVTVLEHVADRVRNLSSQDFRRLLHRFLREQTRDRLLRLLGVPNDVRLYWLDKKRRDRMDRWWEYPDGDLVDWEHPFSE
jgi:hypothetical protein